VKNILSAKADSRYIIKPLKKYNIVVCPAAQLKIVFYLT
jgi:hypothetical protein